MSGKGAKGKQQTQSLVEVFAIVSGEDQGQNEAERNEDRQQASLPEAGQVNHRTDSGSSCSSAQAAIDFSQADGGEKKREEKVG